MAWTEVEKIAGTMLALAKIIAKKPPEKRRIVIREEHLKLFRQFKDSEHVSQLRRFCSENGIKFSPAKVR